MCGSLGSNKLVWKVDTVSKKMSEQKKEEENEVHMLQGHK